VSTSRAVLRCGVSAGPTPLPSTRRNPAISLCIVGPITLSRGIARAPAPARVLRPWEDSARGHGQIPSDTPSAPLTPLLPRLLSCPCPSRLSPRQPPRPQQRLPPRHADCWIAPRSNLPPRSNGKRFNRQSVAFTVGLLTQLVCRLHGGWSCRSIDWLLCTANDSRQKRNGQDGDSCGYTVEFPWFHVLPPVNARQSRNA